LRHEIALVFFLRSILSNNLCMLLDFGRHNYRPLTSDQPQALVSYYCPCYGPNSDLALSLGQRIVFSVSYRADTRYGRPDHFMEAIRSYMVSNLRFRPQLEL
jgi:hypothetical protein